MGNLIKYTDKGFLKEHPFIESGPIFQTHSYIYPGDEIIFYHKLSLPDDAEVSSMNDIKFISAKVSIIAVKPNIFTEEFSREFQATRFFELDSFQVAFDGINARIIPWGVDGYAPFLDVKQNRNWKLPDGDFHRQIRFYTEHTDLTAVWDYWFAFPVLFRWEYWIAMINADNDFFLPSDPQEGLNQWWYHYRDAAALPFGWEIRSRLDLSVLINGVPTIIRNQLNLTPSTNDVNDYDSNADYTLKSVKTSKIGGALSNSPCFVYGNENTVVIGALSKVAAWDIGEQGLMTGLIWMEEFEGPGRSSRTRGSSSYGITPESVFKGLNFSATDDDGLGIQNDTGQFVVFDPAGYGALVLMDAINTEKVRIVAVIDNDKLKTTYPGVLKYTLYARLYNNTLDIDVTRQGEEIKQDATLVTISPTNVVCYQKAPQCGWNLDVYADEDDADEFKNDKSDFYYFGDATITGLTLTLQKNDNSCGDGGYSDVAEITDNTYGKFFEYGKNPDFSGASFTDDYNKQYSGVFLEWREILSEFGTGKYRMKITRTDAFAVETITYDQRTFCLHIYNCDVVNRTVRIETLNEGLRGTFGENDLTDYAGGWNGQIRLKGLLKFKSSAYVKEFNQYGDNDFNKYKPIINEQQPKFVLSIKPVPGWMDFILSTNVLQADEILVTDYNLSNRHVLIKVPLMNDGDLTPKDNNLANPNSSIEISMAFGQNNLRKRNSQ